MYFRAVRSITAATSHPGGFMRHSVLAASLLAAALAAGGCIGAKPMTASDFAGQCYHFNSSEDSPCDSVWLCEEYAAVTQTAHASRDACLAACSSVYDSQRHRFVMRDCAGTAENAMELCVRYCRSNFPQ
jgi:hypothetical protein